MEHATVSSVAWVERGSPEWDQMWGLVASWFDSADCLDPASGEVWQYMGTEYGCHNSRYAWWHCFRHRALPPFGRRHYVWIEASTQWIAEQGLGRAHCQKCHDAILANEPECPACGQCLKGGE